VEILEKEKKAVGNYRWTICALVFMATTVNYLDRQVLSLLQPHLEEQFGWSNSDYANITAVFQFTYAISMLFAGRVIDRLGTKSGYSWAIIVWSIAAILHAFAIPIGESISVLLGWVGIAGLSISVMGLMFGRVVLAIGEAGNFPAAIKATAEYFPKKERSFATGIFNSGSNIGAILAPLTVPWISAHWGWEAAFVVIGATGFLWLIFWLVLYNKPSEQKLLSKEEYDYIHHEGEEQEDHMEKEKVSWFKLFAYRQTWSFALGKFITDGVWWFFLFWLPAFLKAQYQIVGEAVVIPLAVVYTMAMVGSVAGGWFPMFFIKKGYQPYDGRMRAMFIYALFPLMIFLAQIFGDVSFWIPVFLIGIATAAHQAWSANLFTTVSDMFPKKAIGSVVGIGGMAGGIGGVILTKIGGALFDHYRSLGAIETGYTIMFTICGLAYLTAWATMKVLVPKYSVITDL
jgi:ACS family hexuronate transporter-like MFS transporter